MNRHKKTPSSSLRLFEPDPSLVYTIDAVERLAQVPRRVILIYCKYGLVSPLPDPRFGGYYFRHDAVQLLRRIEYLRSTCGINLAGIKLILALTEEVARLKLASAMPAILLETPKTARRQGNVQRL